MNHFCKSIDKVFSEKTQINLKRHSEWKEHITHSCGTLEPASKTTVLTRNRFIAKIYKLFSWSLIAGLVGIQAGFEVNLNQKNFMLLFVELLIFIGLLVLKRNPKWSFPMLFLFTSFSGFTVSTYVNEFIESDKGLILSLALALPAGIFGILSAYVQNSRNDYSFWREFLLSALLILSVSASIGIFFNDTNRSLIYFCFGLMLFCGLIISYASRITLKYNIKEEGAATVDLYFGLFNLFFLIG